MLFLIILNLLPITGLLQHCHCWRTQLLYFTRNSSSLTLTTGSTFFNITGTFPTILTTFHGMLNLLHKIPHDIIELLSNILLLLIFILIRFRECLEEHLCQIWICWIYVELKFLTYWGLLTIFLDLSFLAVGFWQELFTFYFFCGLV